MKVKSHKELIDGHNTVTFFIEDVTTNTLIHSDTFIITKKTKIRQLKADFVDYVLDMQKMEKSLLEAQIHELKKNMIPMNLETINSNNSNNIN
jgi:hypothetical protein